MKYSTYRFTLDLQKHQSQMSITAFKYDTAVSLHISLTDGGRPYYIENGCYAVFYGKRGDKEPLIHPCSIKDNTEIIYKFDETTAAKCGVVECQICVYDSANYDESNLIATARFDILVAERVVKGEDVEIDGKSPTQALDDLFLSEKRREDAEYNREKVFETMKSWDTVIVKKMIDEGKTLNELLANASGKVYVNIPETLEISDEVIEVNSHIKLLEFNPRCILKATHTNGLTIRGYGERSSLYGDCQIIRGANSSWIEYGISDTNYYIDNFLGGVEHCHGNGWLIKNSENISHCRILGLSDCKKITHCTCAFGDYEEMKAENCSIIDELVLDAIIAPKFLGCTNISNIIGTVYHDDSENPVPLTFDNCANISNVKVQNVTGKNGETLIEVKPVYTDCTFVDPYTCDGFLSEDEKGKVRKLTDGGKLEFIEAVEKSEFDSELTKVGGRITNVDNRLKSDIAHLEDNETWDLVITAEKLEGTNLNNLLATASGRVFVKAVGEFQGTTINVPGTVKFIEFAPSVVFDGGMPTVVSIKGTGNESDCQIIKGASTSSADPAWAKCIIEGFKGGVEHCHGEGWVYKDCNNIEHCTFNSFENCKNISKCTSDEGAYNKDFYVTIINCTDIEDLQLADETQIGYKFRNSKFIKNITFSPGTLGLYASLQFENCAYISNVEIQSYYTDCTFVDAYTCAGFLNDEDIGKTQALTKDGSFEIYKEEDVYISTDETIAYEKSVPKDVCPYAEINSVFGITTTLNGTLVPAKVEKIISKDADSVVIDEVAIPNSVKNDAMWGCGVKNIGRNLTTREYFANTYYFDAKQYVKWVSKTITIDGTKLTATNVQKNSNTGNWCVSVRLGADEFSDYTACALNGFSSSMSRTYGTAYISGFADGTYAMLFINANINTIEAANEWFKNNPVSIQYALKNPIITVVEDTKQSYMLVKGGGSVVCENTNKADAMCSITYLLKGGNT